MHCGDPTNASGTGKGKPCQSWSLKPHENTRITTLEEQRDQFGSIAEMLRPWQGRTTAMETIFPKTGDIQKILANKAKAPVLNEMMGQSEAVREQMQTATGAMDDEEIDFMFQAGAAGQRAIRAVNPTKSILTSLILPLVAFAASVVVFLRRDY